MKQAIQWTVLVFIPLFFSGCLSPVKNEIALVGGSVSEKPADGDAKLIIFNDSSYMAFGLDGSGRINVKLNGKGVGQIKIYCYAQVIVPKGKYQVELTHRDTADFTSQHEIEFTNSINFLEIFATTTSNKAFLISQLPTDFNQKFKPIENH